MELNGFNKILDFFIDVCRIPNRNLSCAIWLNSTDITEYLKNKVCKRITNIKDDIIDITTTRNNIRIIFKNGSTITILAADAITATGYRFHLSAYKYNINDYLIQSMIIPMSTLGFPPLSFRDSNCDHCICKTCSLAYINGGAEGCGNCYECDSECGINSCKDYYNPIPVQEDKNDNRN